MATVTIYADSDGQIRSWSEANYSLCRAGNNLSANAAATSIHVGQSGCSDPFGPGGPWDDASEGFLSFDTNGLVGVTAVTLSLFMQGAVFDNGGAGINEVRTLDWGTTLTTADWIAGASLGTPPLVASWSRPGGYTGAPSIYTDYVPNGTALLTSLNLTGFSRYIVNSSHHRLGNPPGYSSSCNYLTDWFWASEQTGTTQDPKLVITTGTTPVGAWGAIQN